MVRPKPVLLTTVANDLGVIAGELMGLPKDWKQGLPQVKV